MNKLFFCVENDAISLQENLFVIFSPSTSAQQCFLVGIVADNFVENDKVVTLELQTNNEDIVLSPSTATITISDDDSETL